MVAAQIIHLSLVPRIRNRSDGETACPARKHNGYLPGLPFVSDSQLPNLKFESLPDFEELPWHPGQGNKIPIFQIALFDYMVARLEAPQLHCDQKKVNNHTEVTESLSSIAKCLLILPLVQASARSQFTTQTVRPSFS